MRYYITIFIVITGIILPQCSVMRPPQPTIVDSVRVEVVERIERVTDTIYISVPAEKESQTTLDTMSHLETSFAVSDAIVHKDGKLYHSLENKPQNWQKEVTTEVVARDSLVYKDRVVTEVVEVPAKLSKWQQIKMDGFVVLFFLAIIIIFAKAK